VNILLLNIVFPELETNSNLYGDLAVELAARGHSMRVATLLERRTGRETQVRTQRGVEVLHVASGDLFDVSFMRKGLTMLRLERDFRRAIARTWPKERFDLVIYPTPPITFVGLVEELKQKQRCTTYLILRDIFPQNAVDLGVMSRRGIAYRYFRRVERRLYAVSDRIGVLSPANAKYVREHSAVPGAKLELLPNWRKVRDAGPSSGRDLRGEWGVAGKTIAVFGGVLGIAQELEFLLDLAREMRHRDDLAFVIVGWGNQRSRLQAIAERAGLRNVVFPERVPSADFSRFVRQADIGLVNLNRRFTIPNFPSKVLDYFEAGVPVLAALDSATDFGAMIDACGGGLWSSTGDLPAYRRNLERLLDDPGLRREMGRRGRRYIEEHFTVERACDTILGSAPAAARMARGDV
jgi:glycosyltransferase involved in cell wall biosynthesis